MYFKNEKMCRTATDSYLCIMRIEWGGRETKSEWVREITAVTDGYNNNDICKIKAKQNNKDRNTKKHDNYKCMYYI